MKAYNIKFSGLKLGSHDFVFDVEDDFFSLFEESEIDKGKLKVQVSLDKRESMMVLDFKIKGIVEVACDKCLDELMLPLQGENMLIVKFGEELIEETEEVVVLPQAEYQINIAQYIYEFIMLLLPGKRIHPKGKCDEDMIRRIEELEKNKQESTDPRWAGLSDFKSEDK